MIFHQLKIGEDSRGTQHEQGRSRLLPLAMLALAACNAEHDEPASAKEVEAAIQRSERELDAADAQKPAAQKHAQPSAAIALPN